MLLIEHIALGSEKFFCQTLYFATIALNMTLLPIVERELRVASRQASTYWSRFGAAAVAIALECWLIGMGGHPAEVGYTTFIAVAIFLFFYVLLAGIQVTCDCLSEEKREGTLGLLFLTDLKGYDVVFGKLSATSVRITYGVAATIPILALPLLIGGVAYGEFWRVVLTIFNILFFSLGVGLLASSLCRSAPKALGIAALIAVVILGFAPFCSAIAHNFSSSALDKFMVTSPAYNCFAAFENFYVSYRKAFWACIICTQFYGWVFIGLACWLVPRSWRDESLGVKEKPSLLAPFKAKLTRAYRPIGEEKPYVWRCLHSYGPRRALLKVLFGILSIGAAFGLMLWTDNYEIVFIFVPPILNIVVKSWAIFKTTVQINEDRRSGGLELLLATPLRETDLFEGQTKAFWKHFSSPLVVVFLVDVIAFVVFQLKENHDIDTAIYLFTGLVTLFSDMYVIPWISMWKGLTCRTSNRAAGQVFLLILVVPSILSLILCGILSRALREPRNIFELWGCVSVTCAVFVYSEARRRLRSQFRARVAHQDSPAIKS